MIPLDNKIHWLKNLLAEQVSLANASSKFNTLIRLSHAIQIRWVQPYVVIPKVNVDGVSNLTMVQLGLVV